MATRKPSPRVKLTHPSGKFTVEVTPQRATILEERGYVPVASRASSGGKGKPAGGEEG